MDSLLKPFRKILIRSKKRYAAFVTDYPGFRCHAIDKSSFLSMYHEIFEREIYRFKAETDSPIIIDCGANIGLSVIYFKRLYPKARIIAFEPDPRAYEALSKNIEALKLDGITLIKKGLGKDEATKAFFSEGADGGRLALESDTNQITDVEVTKLSPFLQNHVDFLKIDIEGSELEVMEECKDALARVDTIFIEYHSLASKPQKLDTILNMLAEAGFRYYIDRTGIASDRPFIRLNTHLGYDLQLNISAKKI